MKSKARSSKMVKWKFWEREWKSVKCAACQHTGHEHRNISVEKPKKNGMFDGYDIDWSCKICDCKQYYREDYFSRVKCQTCGIEYFATSAGNPDGIYRCPNGHRDHPFEPYCPGPGGARYTPEEWDRLYGDKK